MWKRWFYSLVENIKWPRHTTKRGTFQAIKPAYPSTFLLKCLYNVPCQESELSCICVSCFSFDDFRLHFGIVRTVWYYYIFQLINFSTRQARYNPEKLATQVTQVTQVTQYEEKPSKNTTQYVLDTTIHKQT